MDFSSEALHALRALAVKAYQEDKLPEGVDAALADYLVARGLVTRMTMEPPGKENSLYPDGLSGYQTNEAGKEEIRLADERAEKAADEEAKHHDKETAKERKRVLFEIALAIVSALVGKLLD